MSGHPIPSLYPGGGIVGGLYYHNYASGTGLMSGAVFGRIVGKNAAACAKAPRERDIPVAVLRKSDQLVARGSP
jgi:uncharacterized membrane protein